MWQGTLIDSAYCKHKMKSRRPVIKTMCGNTRVNYSTDDFQLMGPIRSCQNCVWKHAEVSLLVSLCDRKLWVPPLPRTKGEYCIIYHQLGKTHRLKDHFYLKYIAFLHSKLKRSWSQTWNCMSVFSRLRYFICCCYLKLLFKCWYY